MALSLVDVYAVRRPSPVIYRGGLAPARLRKVTEFVQSRIDDDMTLEQMAASVNLSVAHSSQMFRLFRRAKSPHQFVSALAGCARERNSDEYTGNAGCSMLPWPADSKHSSTLRGCFVRCAERRLPKIAKEVLR